MNLEDINLTQNGPIYLGILLGALVLLFVLARIVRKLRGKREEDWVKQVREYVQMGNLEAAGRIQFTKGNVLEAYNIFARGNVHDRASACAERLDWPDKAAEHAEKANKLERAAKYYLIAERYADAARVFQRLNKARETAETLERVGDVKPIDMATAWEAAYIEAVPEEGEVTDEATAQAIATAATKAAKAYKMAGKMDQAARFVDLSKRAKKTLSLQTSLRLSNAAEAIKNGDAEPSLAAAEDVGLADTLLPGTTLADLGIERPPKPGAVANKDDEEPPTPVAIPRSKRPAPVAMQGVPEGTVSDSPPAEAVAVASPAQAAGQVKLGRITPAGVVQSPVDRSPVDRDMVGAIVEEVLARREPSPVVVQIGTEVTAALSHDDAVDDRAPTAAQPRIPPPGSAGVPVISRVEVVNVPDSSTEKVTQIRRETERYLLGDKLGEGGMGVVYKARDRVLDRNVALKFLPEGVTQGVMRRMFEQEAKAVAKLNHPGIITIHDFGVLDERPFICMELVDGETVETLIEEHGDAGMPLEQVLEIAANLVKALDYAHKNRLVHRDIKPANIMQTSEGLTKLMDFGIAKLVEPDKTTKIAGTPAYMAPEQMTGKGVDHRTDLFAVGVTLYEMIANELPFDGLRRSTKPQALHFLRPDVPISLDDVIQRCLAERPEERPQSAGQVHDSIKLIVRELELGPTESQDDWVVGSVEDESPAPSEKPTPNEQQEPIDDLAPNEEPASNEQPAPNEEPAPNEQIDEGDVVDILKRLSWQGVPDEKQSRTHTAFLTAMRDSRTKVRISAAATYPGPIAGSDNKSIRERFRVLLWDDEESVRIAAAERLGFEGAAAAGLLVERVQRTDPHRLSTAERQTLFRSLAEAGGDDALPVFERLFESMKGSVPSSKGTAAMDDLLDALARSESAAAKTLRIKVRDHRSPPGEANRDVGAGHGILKTPMSMSKQARVKPKRPPTPEPKDLPPEVEAMLKNYLHGR